MSLSERLAKAKVPGTKSLCKIGLILVDESLPKAERETLLTVLNVEEGTPGRLPNSTIAKILREEGYDLSNSAVDRHRKQDCPCARKAN